MKQDLVHIALVVRDYDEALDFYTEKLHFTIIEDTYQPEQLDSIGAQSCGRVFLFLNTDDFWRDYNEMVKRDIEFVGPPKEAEYGTVAVFKDLYGNLWDLLKLKKDHHIKKRLNCI